MTEQMVIQFGPVDINHVAHHPRRSYSDDAGYDLVTTQWVTIEPGQFCDLPTNVWVALPPGYWGLVTGRSSALRKHGLLVHNGVIDAGYRGELYAGAFNLTDQPVKVEPGQRLAQFIPIPLSHLATVWQRSGPPDGTRGVLGFGSTGT